MASQRKRSKRATSQWELSGPGQSGDELSDLGLTQAVLWRSPAFNLSPKMQNDPHILDAFP